MKKFGLLLSSHLILSLFLYLAFQAGSRGWDSLSVPHESLREVSSTKNSESANVRLQHQSLSARPEKFHQNTTNSPRLALTAGIVSTSNRNGVISPTLPLEPLFAPPASFPAWSGLINSARLATSPIDGNVSNLDGDDLVTIAVVVENQALDSPEVFDIRVRALFPEGLRIPSSPLMDNLQVQTGNGSPVLVESAEGGLFAGEIMLRRQNDGVSVLTGFEENSGTNIAVITFDVAIEQAIAPSITLPIHVEVVGYTYVVDGTDVVAELPSALSRDETYIDIRTPKVAAFILGTSQIHTSDTMTAEVPLAVGEIVTYSVEVEIPEGRISETYFKSELDKGYGLVGVESITASPNLTTTLPGGFEEARASVRLINTSNPQPDQGQMFDIYFGALAVRNDGADGPGLIEIRYQVAALNNEYNRQNEGEKMRNHYLQFCWGDVHHMVVGHTPNTYLVEPRLHVSQTITPTQPSVGDLVTVTVEVSHLPVSQSDAYEVLWSNDFAPGLDYIATSLQPTGGEAVPDTLSTTVDSAIRAEWLHLPLNARSVLEFQAVVTDSHLPTSHLTQQISLTNEGLLKWSSLPGTQNQALSRFHDLAAERTGNPADVGGELNTYRERVSSTLLVTKPPSHPEAVWLEAELAVSNLTRSDGPAQSGDALQYQLRVRNLGKRAATGVIVRNRLDTNLALDHSSIQLSQGTIQADSTQNAIGIALDVGNVEAEGSAFMTYTATVRDGLPPGVTQVANQALVYGDNFPLTLSDDPLTPFITDPTLFYLISGPQLVALSQVFLEEDLDGDGVVSAGDGVFYEIQIINRGFTSAESVEFYNQIPPGSALRFDTIETSQGTVVVGDAPGDGQIQINVGQIEPQSAVTIRYQTIVNALQSVLITEIQSQGTVLAANHPVVQTDNPESLSAFDPTILYLTEGPHFEAVQSHHLFEDADQNGVPSVGDSMAHLISVQNLSSLSVTDVTVTNSVDPLTGIVTDSARLAVQGDLTDATAERISAQFSELEPRGAFAARDRGVLSYVVEINQSIPQGVTTVANQGMASGSGFSTVLTSDPYNAGPESETRTVISKTDYLRIWKRDILLVDTNQDGAFSPPENGVEPDRLVYQIRIENWGTVAASQVVVEDLFDEHVQLVPDSLRTSRGTVIVGDTADSKSVLIDLGALPRRQFTGAGEAALISFEVEIAAGEAPEQIANTASLLVSVETDDVGGTNQHTLSSDDPDTLQPTDATVTQVLFVPTGLRELDEPIGKEVTPTIFVPLLFIDRP